MVAISTQHLNTVRVKIGTNKLFQVELAEFPPALLIPAVLALLIPILAIYFGHKQDMKRMDLIEKGLWKPEYETREALFVGFVLTGLGVAILIGSLWITLEPDLRLGGLMALFVGMALILYDRIKRR